MSKPVPLSLALTIGHLQLSGDFHHSKTGNQDFLEHHLGDTSLRRNIGISVVWKLAGSRISFLKRLPLRPDVVSQAPAHFVFNYILYFYLLLLDLPERKFVCFIIIFTGIS